MCNYSVKAPVLTVLILMNKILKKQKDIKLCRTFVLLFYKSDVK